MVSLLFFTTMTFAGKKLSCMHGDEEEDIPHSYQESVLRDEYNGPDVMIVGATYAQSSYKQYALKRQLSPYFLVDLDDHNPTDIRHDISNPFPSKYKGKFQTVIFEQLPIMAITRQSILNILDVLKPDGRISMSCPFSLVEINVDFPRDTHQYHLQDGRVLWKYDASLAFLEKTGLRRSESQSYQGSDAFDVLQRIIPSVFSNEFGLNEQQIIIVSYDRQSHGKYWFKNRDPNPPYLVFIMK